MKYKEKHKRIGGRRWTWMIMRKKIITEEDSNEGVMLEWLI